MRKLEKEHARNGPQRRESSTSPEHGSPEQRGEQKDHGGQEDHVGSGDDHLESGSHEHTAQSEDRGVHREDGRERDHGNHGDGGGDGDHGDHGGHEDDGSDGDHGGHGGHGHHSPEMFRRRFWLSLLLTIPVLIYSHHIQMWFHFTPPRFPGSGYIPFVLGTIIFFYGGMVFIQGAKSELQARKPGMMTLIGLAISVAFIYSFAVTLGFPGEELYWELATLVTIMLLGHWLEMRAIQGASGALQELAKLLPDQARRIVDDEIEEVPTEQLRPGDLILIRPGEQVPADGLVEQGESYLNEAMITGESKPVFKGTEDRVIAGTVNEDGSLRVRIEKAGGETTLAGIMALLEQAQSSSTRSQALADRAAFWLVLVALGAAGITAVAWSAAQAGVTFTLERVVTVLIIACPHALGLAIPLVIAISTTLSAKNGLLVKNRLSLEEARKINCVVFDKTGTLTRGEQVVMETRTVEGVEEEELLRLAAAAEADSEHMIARGVAQAAREKNLSLPPTSSFTALPGRGVRAEIQDQTVYVGGPNLLEQLELTLPAELEAAVEQADQEGQSTLFVVQEGRVIGLFRMADEVRQESREAVNALRARGVRVVMLTGDRAAVAESVSRELGIDQYFAGVLPQHKAEKVAQLQQEGYRVAMVGDGVNDAPALALADVGIAIGAGTDIAVESAGIILVRNDPRDVVRLFNLSRATYRKMVQNLGWAVGYNILAIPLAAGILAPVGFILPMAVGAVVMSASTIIVAFNAQLLRRLDMTSLA